MLERIQSQRYFVNHTTDARLAPFGQDYTLIGAANLLGMSKSCLHKRLKGTKIITDAMISPPKARNLWPILESDSDRLSAKWLKRSIVNV
tara:strand:+ start:399 stop:668 length:270 start_codon:yes stop_codon:yes gene_type:complete